MMEVVILSKGGAHKHLAGKLSEGTYCYFLSDDYVAWRKIRQTLATPEDLRLLGPRFHEAVCEIQEAYLELCHRINFLNQSERYWATHLSSRNAASIPLLKYLVYLRCAQTLIATSRATKLVLVVESRAVAKAIRAIASSFSIPSRIIFPFMTLPRRLYLPPLQFLKGGYFVVYGMLRWFYARHLKNPRITATTDRERYLLRSWITPACWLKNNSYVNRNFGDLARHLEAEGREVWNLPVFYFENQGVLPQLRKMAESGERFLITEQYISLGDLFRTLWDGIRGLALTLPESTFMEMNVGEVVREVHRESCLSVSLLFTNTSKYLIRRLAKRGVNLNHIIYPIENNVVEKPFLLAVRRYYPKASLTGLQQSVWMTEQLGMFLHPDESRYHPLPDRIVCMGRRYLDILKSAGFPEQLLTVGPNLRYPQIHQFQGLRGVRNGAVKNILLILSSDPRHTLELLEKVHLALLRIRKFPIQISIKPHFTTNLREVETFLREIQFPPYKWVSGTVQECASRSHAVLMTGMSVANLEVIGLGVPLIRVSLDNNFDFDPLWDPYPLTDFVSTPERIAKLLGRVLEMGNAEQEKLVEFGQKLVKEYFEAETKETLRVFFQ